MSRTNRLLRPIFALTLGIMIDYYGSEFFEAFSGDVDCAYDQLGSGDLHTLA